MRRDAIWAILMLCLTVFVYWGGRDYAYVWDDYRYIETNPFVSEGLSVKNLIWACQTQHCNWHPMVWLSFMVDVELWGFQPRGFHLTNLLMHAANAWLLWLWLRKVTGNERASAFVAAVFAAHPLHVESVQWISERKDTLSMFFGLLTMLAWHRFIQARSLVRFIPVLGSYLGSLLSKQMFVTLPILLLVIDVWPLRRCFIRERLSDGTGADVETGSQTLVAMPAAPVGTWTELVLEKLPLCVIAGLFCFVAIVAQHVSECVPPADAFPLVVRLANAVHAYWLYLGRALAPKNLIIFYPHPGPAIVSLRTLGEFVALIAVTVVVIQQRHIRPYLLTGWLWFVVSLLPVIGIVQVGEQQMADRYAYLPLIGIYLAATWWCMQAFPTGVQRRIRLIAGVVVIAILARVAHHQVEFWKDNRTLNNHMREVLRDRE